MDRKRKQTCLSAEDDSKVKPPRRIRGTRAVLGSSPGGNNTFFAVLTLLAISIATSSWSVSFN